MAEEQVRKPSGAPPAGDLTGTSVGRFAVRTRLGAGGMGEVYRAEDTVLRRTVALKRLAPRLAADEDYRRRFLKEAQRASRLNDPHIASIYDVFEQNQETFLVMEYVEGKTLRELLGQPYTPESFLNVATQCTEALQAAHEKGIVHRDLKPENIMVTPQGQIKVLDFGVARELPRSTETSATASVATEGPQLRGTPAYMAPEALLEKGADERSDLFSLGVVFYEMLTARHPFYAGGVVATGDRILHSAPPSIRQLNPQAPEALDWVVAKLLVKDPAGRFASAADLLSDLRALERPAHGATPRLKSEPLPPRFDFAHRPERSVEGRPRWNRALSLSAVAAVLLAAAIVVWRARTPIAPRARLSVTVLPYINRTGDPRLDTFRLTLTQILVLDLAGSPNIKVLPYERLIELTRALEGEAQPAAAGQAVSTSEAIQTLANYTNARYVVLPTMFALGNTLRVTAEFHDAQTGETVDVVQVDHTLAGPPEETIYRMQDELANSIEEKFRKLARGQADWPRPGSTRPKTVAAALHFTEGKNAFAHGDYAQALSSFDRAIDEDPTFALAYARLGQIDGVLGYDEKARALSEKAAQLIRPDMPVIDADFIQANLAEQRYDHASAIEKYRELIRLYPDEPGAYVDLAAIYEKQGQYQSAIAQTLEALARDPNHIVAHQKLALLYSRTGDFAQGLTHAQKALELYRVLGNREGEANVELTRGEILRLKGDFSQAEQSTRSALDLFQKLNNEAGRLHATKVLGDVAASRGDLSGARGNYQQVISRSREVRDNRLVALTYMNLGVIYSEEGNLSKAIEYYQRGTETPAQRERAQALTNLAGLLVEYGPDARQGFRDAQEALPIFRTMGDKLWEGNAWMHVGLYELDAGQYPSALEHLEQAQALFRGIDYKRGIAQSLYTIGRRSFVQNRYEQALDATQQALNTAEGAGDQFKVAMSKILLGWIETRLGDFAKAVPLLNEGAQSAEKRGYGELLPNAYNALGELHREQGEIELARKSFQQASDLWKGEFAAESSIEARAGLGRLEAERGNAAPGFVLCRAALERARKLGKVHALAAAQLDLARAYLAVKQYAQAENALHELGAPGGPLLGPEWRAQIDFTRARALEGLGKKSEAKAAREKARAALRELQDTLSVEHRRSLESRPEIAEIAR